MRDHTITFNDGHREFVTAQAYAKVLELSSKPNIKSFQMNGNLYKFCDIRRMQEPKQNLNQIDRLLKNRPRAKQIRALENMMIGLKKYIASDKFKGTKEPGNLLLTMEARHKQHTEAL